jgi:hypothetical protein
MSTINRRSFARPLVVVVGFALAMASALVACNKGNGKSPPLIDTSSDAGPTVSGIAGSFGSGIGGHIGGNPTGTAGSVDAGPASGTVVIAIQSPMADSILSNNAGADIAAKVTITGGSDVVDPATVRATLVQMGGTGTVSAAPLVGPMGQSLFTGKISLAGLTTGDYTLTVTAASSGGATGSAQVKLKIDGGPIITVLSPTAGHHYKGSLVAQVLIDPGLYGPLSGMPSCSIAGMPVTLQPTGNANLYRAVFDLTMPTMLTGDQLFEVSAKDSGPSGGTRTDIKLTFNVDITGPTITMTAPVPGAIVGGVVKISAVIDDGAGVDASSVQVLIGDETTTAFRLPLMADASVGDFSTLFDTNNLTKCKLNTDPCIVRPTLSFRASDLLGNESVVSYPIAIDNIPPIADFFPPMIRDSKIDGVLRCSWKFDPLDYSIVAGDAPDDGCVVPQVFDLRARIEDDGNHAAGLKQIPISTVDPLATAAYVLDSTVVNGVPQPLVVDTDGDGWCDAVNPQLQPTTEPITGPRQVLKVRLAPVPPGGTADFTPDPSLPIPLPGGGVCSIGLAAEIPENLCKPGPEPSIAISYAGGLPAIWSIEPIKPDMNAYCFGAQFDTKANKIAAVTSTSPNLAPAAGWKCIAVVTADKLGNASTSAPLRVYLKDYAYSGADPFAAGSFCNQAVPSNAGPAPDCTGTFDKATGTLSQKACKSRSFQVPPGQIEVCYKGDCDIVSEFH